MWSQHNASNWTAKMISWVRRWTVTLETKIIEANYDSCLLLKKDESVFVKWPTSCGSFLVWSGKSAANAQNPAPAVHLLGNKRKLQSLSQQRALLGSALSSTQGAKGSAPPPPPHHQCPSQVRWPIHRSIQQRRVLNHRRHRKPPGPGNPAIRHMPSALPG